jgi:hypothetical protein
MIRRAKIDRGFLTVAAAFPVAQRDGILTESIDGELVVVDSRTQQAHALPAFAATVWSLCDGNHGVAAIAARTGFSPDQVTDVIAQLRELDLLETAGGDNAVDRRAMLSRTAKLGGAAALAAPILSVALPAAAAHASGTSGTPATYMIQFANYTPAGTGYPAYYGYVVTPASNGSVPVGTGSPPFSAQDAYAGSTSPASSSAPTGESYVEIAVNSDGSLQLTLFQYNGAGSATYTGPGVNVIPTVSIMGTQEPGFSSSSGSATLVVSAT